MGKAKWVIDKAHTSVDFSIKHMMIATVKGTFHQFDANIEADPLDLTTANIEFSVDLSSVDTRNEDRDNHLRSADFFDVEKYPKMTFTATKITKKDDGEYAVTGNLNLHGITREETFDVVFEGMGKDPWGNEKVGYSVTGKIKRSDYDLKYNAVLETGGVLIGDEVKVMLDIEASMQA